MDSFEKPKQRGIWRRIGRELGLFALCVLASSLSLVLFLTIYQVAAVALAPIGITLPYRFDEIGEVFFWMLEITLIGGGYILAVSVIFCGPFLGIRLFSLFFDLGIYVRLCVYIIYSAAWAYPIFYAVIEGGYELGQDYYLSLLTLLSTSLFWQIAIEIYLKRKGAREVVRA